MTNRKHKKKIEKERDCCMSSLQSSTTESAITAPRVSGVMAVNAVSARKQRETLLRIVILAMIFVLAFSTRLFSVLRFESVIHEVQYDPYIPSYYHSSRNVLLCDTFVI